MTDPFAIRGPAVLNVSGGRTSALMLRRVLDARGENARCRSAALATARREGAEEMRWQASEAAESWLRAVEEVTQDSPADLADAIRALPLDDEGLCDAAQRVTRERDVLRAQQAPIVACVDALRAAARAAGWRDADATGETLVAWVRRGERKACARIADDEMRDSEGNEGAVCAAQSIAAKIRGREGGE